MKLDSKQLSSLQEMGIPVWELRNTQVQKPQSEDEAAPVSKLSQQQLLENYCFVMIDAESHTEQAQQLLVAILFSVGLSLEHIILIQEEDLSQLETLNDPQKILIIMGVEVKEPSSQPLVKNSQVHQIVNANIAVLRTLSLTSLLSQPQGKEVVWQDLKLVKEFLN